MRVSREQILDVAREVLGRKADAGMGEIAAAAGVVRRTVYGHFPARADLVRALTQRAVGEIAADLAEVDDGGKAADEVWVEFVARLWPLAHRYRVLVVLRRSEYGNEIHSLLAPVEDELADLVGRGQASGAFGHHLPADLLSRMALAGVFTVADADQSRGGPGVRAAAMTSLLLLGVPDARATALSQSVSA